MSLNEYNKHSMLGPFAGPATTVASIAGQEAYKRAHEQPVYVGGDGIPLSVSGALWGLAAFIVVGALGTAGAFLLPENLAAISGFVAFMAIIGLVILGVAAGIEAVKRATEWVVSSMIEHGWWRIIAVALTTFVFAALHADVLGPIANWMATLFASALALTARLAPTLRSACAALGAGAITYILAASYAFEDSTIIALLAGVLVAVTIYKAKDVLRSLRRRS